MAKLLPSVDVAAQLGMDDRTIRRLAVEHEIGQKIGRNWVFSPSDIRRLSLFQRRPGRPRREDKP